MKHVRIHGDGSTIKKNSNLMPPITISYVKEKWAHAGFQKYFQNISWSFAGQIFSLVMSFFIGALVARYLGPERYGVLNYALSFVTVFVFLASFGVDNILVRELLKYKEKSESILNTAFVIKIFGGVLIIITASLISLAVNSDPYITGLIFIYSLHLIFLSLNVTNSYFQATVKHKFLFTAQFVSTIAVSLLKLYFVYNGFGVGWFILALVFETALSSFIVLRFFQKSDHVLKFSPDLGLARKLLTDSWPFIFSTAFYLIYTKIDQVMIGKMIDTKALGIYSAGVRVAELWYFVPAIICGVIFPAIANAKLVNQDLYEKRIKKVFILVTSISVLFALAQLVFAKHIILFLFGQAYLGSVEILKIYTWAGVIVSAIIIFHQYLIIENKTRILMVSSFMGAGANVLLNLLFIPQFGIVGSALATLISYAIIPVTILLSLKFDSIKNA